ncbi:hypothetical protein COLO4_03008 [Corchorus olitorius]|uniref:Uncharacterized protein n=1 Tax=Corchorus olitorius TaxID=93759 RepID=A0A1R3KZP5_9ROSI|nr:hypothetical protein COLO4_03008 [Corchorus olitorius]
MYPKYQSSEKVDQLRSDEYAHLSPKSRVRGAKYSYQWMALAQQNNWHVLLDAGSLGPKGFPWPV